MLVCQVSNVSLLAQGQQKRSIEKLKNTTSIYLDPMGNVVVIASTWDLIVYYNMDPYFDMIKRGKILNEKMRGVCGKLHGFEEQCNSVRDNTQRQITDLEDNNNFFMTQDSKRFMRATFEFMGSLYHKLFGINCQRIRKILQI